MSVVRDLILQADDQLRYPSGGELRSMVEYLSRGAERLAVVRLLTDNEKKIVDESAKQLFQRNPDYVAPGGNAYGEEMTASCLRDMDYYLRLVTYGVVAGDVTPIEEIGIIGAREMYRALGTPLEAMAEAVREMKGVATSILTGADAEEAGTYFDYVVGALS